MSLHVRMRSRDECVIVCHPSWLGAMHTALRDYRARRVGVHPHEQWVNLEHHVRETMYAHGLTPLHDVVPDHNRLVVQGPQDNIPRDHIRFDADFDDQPALYDEDLLDVPDYYNEDIEPPEY